MTYQDAANQARQQSQDGCVQHVNGHIEMVDDSGLCAIDPDDYYVSDWMDGTTQASYVNGEMI